MYTPAGNLGRNLPTAIIPTMSIVNRVQAPATLSLAAWPRDHSSTASSPKQDSPLQACHMPVSGPGPLCRPAWAARRAAWCDRISSS